MRSYILHFNLNKLFVCLCVQGLKKKNEFQLSNFACPEQFLAFKSYLTILLEDDFPQPLPIGY